MNYTLKTPNFSAFDAKKQNNGLKANILKKIFCKTTVTPNEEPNTASNNVHHLTISSKNYIGTIC